MKLPVISTTVSGIPELVRAGCGFLIPEKNVPQLAEAIEELCRDKNLRISMGESGRKVVEKDFNLKIQSRKLSDLFECAQKNERHDNLYVLAEKSLMISK